MGNRRKKILMYSQLKIICRKIKLKIMQKLMQSRFFRLLSEASQNEDYTSQLEESYDEFALKILTRLQLETNHAELCYSLGFIHLKLAGICERLSSEQEKKRLKNSTQNHVFGRISDTGAGMANKCAKQYFQN
jgi:hypothetical protein